MIRIGIIGTSPGNGHPYSFSAIFNGYDSRQMRDAGWPQIAEYLDRQPKENFGIQEFKVTHAWTQDLSETQKLCKSTFIKNACSSTDDWLSAVDVVIIARDDWETHFPMAKEFLLAGMPVFIDKPLTLNDEELDFFSPYLRKGLLMSASGFRFGEEIQKLRPENGNLGRLRLIQGVVVNDFERYGIHLIEAVSTLFPNILDGYKVQSRGKDFDAFDFYYPDGLTMSIFCSRDIAKTFDISFYFEQGKLELNLRNNFYAFKAMLTQFTEMVIQRRPKIDPDETIKLMRLLISGRATRSTTTR